MTRFEKFMNSAEGIKIQIQTREEGIARLTEKSKTASKIVKDTYLLSINDFKQEIKELKNKLS